MGLVWSIIFLSILWGLLHLIFDSCRWAEKSERRRTKEQSLPSQFVPLAKYLSVAANIPLSNDSGATRL